MSEMNIIPVSSVLERIKRLLETGVDLNEIWIQGEISNLTKHRSGHYYFSLKDSNGSMSCVMFSSYVRHMTFDTEEGMKVLVKASVSIYNVRGSLQLYVKQMKPDGIGALFLEFEQRKKRLLAQGFFDESHKTKKPDYIGNIAIITAKEGAAIQDVISTIRKRWPMMQMRLYPALVQGANAAATMVSQLLKADQVGYDAILLVRGGGSFEDLFCFNDETLIQTIYTCKTYIVSGVGHEVDTTLCDLVADHRSVTPTAAAQWVSLDQKEIYAHIAANREQIRSRIDQILLQQKTHLRSIRSNTYLQDPNTWIIDKRLKLDGMEQQLDQSKDAILRLESDIVFLKDRLSMNLQKKIETDKIQYEHTKEMIDRAMERYQENSRKKLMKQIALLDAYSPLKVLTRGYSITTKNNQLIRFVGDIHEGETMHTRLQDGIIVSKVIKKES